MITKFTPTREGKKKEIYPPSKVVFNFSGVDMTNPPIELQDSEFSNALNVYKKDNQVRTREGYDTWGNGLPLADRPIMNIEQFYKYDGTEYVCVFTDKCIYKYNTSTEYFDLISPSTTVEDCEDAWTASTNVTDSSNTTYARYGTNCRKFAIDGAFTTGLIAYEDFGSMNLTTYSHIHCYVRSSVALSAGQLQLCLDDTSACVSPLETINFPAIAANTTKEVLLTISTPSNLTAVISVGLKLASDPGACDIYIDNITAVDCLTGDTDDKICCESIYDDDTGEMKFIMCNGVDAPMYWNGTGNWANLAGSPNIGKWPRNFYHHLLLFSPLVGGNLAPQRIDWSDIGDPKNWSTGLSGSVNLAATPDEIIGDAFLRGYICILKKTSISMMQYTGSTDVFNIDENKIKDIGCCAKGSIQSLGDSVLFLGWDNVYIYDGFSVKSVGDKVRRDMFENINPSKLNTIHSHILEQHGLYLLFLPSLTSSYPDHCWVYNYENNYWCGKWEFADNFTCSGFYQSFSKITIGELISKIGTMDWKIGSASLTDVATNSLFGSSDGYIYMVKAIYTSDNGTAIDSYIDTKSFCDEGVDKYTRYPGIVFFGRGTTVTVYTSTDDGRSWNNKGSLTLTSEDNTGKFFRSLETTGKRIMLRFRNNTVDGWFSLEGLRLLGIPKDEVVT